MFKKTAVLYLLVPALLLTMTHLSSRAVTVIAESIPVSARKIFVIDPGHGGEDGGAVSVTGTAESRLNLEISLRLNALLQFLGRDTRLIRREDRSVYTQGDTLAAKKISDLRQRVKLTQAVPGAVLISIHQNMFHDSRYRGAQVFYNETGKAFAEAMQNALKSNLDTDRRAKKAGGIYLLDRIHCPGILVECGFLSNGQEARLLESPDYQKKLAVIIAGAASSYWCGTP